MSDIVFSEESIRFRIKRQISNEPDLYKSLSDCKSLSDLVSVLTRRFSQEYEGFNLPPLIHEISAEIIRLRESPGEYLVNSEGKTLFKITPDMLYTPPSSVSEDGRIINHGVRLHPKISSAIALAVHESEKIIKLEKKYPDSRALDHLRKPDYIGTRALEFISHENRSIRFGVDDTKEFTEEFIIIGKENIEGVYQAFNPSFVRAEVFAKSLARAILGRQPGRVSILSVDRKTDSKSSWYSAHVLFQSV
jgi:hypothetical protein